MTSIRTTCPYCGVGCGVQAKNLNSGAVSIAGDPDHPANHGRLCSKGMALAETLGLETRLLHPIVSGNRASWDDALTLVANKFMSSIQEHGPDSVAFYVSGQLLTEDYYVANKLMKGFIGSGNIDTNSRLCMSSAVAGHKRAFGADAVPGCYEDWERADLVVLVGSNTAWCHPILYQRLLKARAVRGTKIVVIDPRRTPTCDEADLHLAIKPGTDVRLFNALFAQLVKRSVADQEFIRSHTVNFGAALASALREDTSTKAIAHDCEVDAAVIETFFSWFGETERTLTVFSQGVNQSTQGVDKVNAIINCHLATGRIGKPGAGPFSITGQPNAMGGREVGGLANQLAAHMDFSNEADRDRVARFWNSNNLSQHPGLKAVDMFHAAGQGKIRVLWIMATNPAASLPDSSEVRRALKTCEFVIVSDCVANNDTIAYADVLFPAAAWGEKDGTVTNSERRISRQRAFRSPAGESLPDWQIICEVARRMGFADAFPYETPAEIFRDHAALSGFENEGERDFNISGLSELTDAEYDVLMPIQWPITEANPRGTQRLFEDARYFTEDSRAQFVAMTAKGPAYATNLRFPLILNSGRTRDQWHTMTRSGLSARLSSHRSEPFVEIHPEDAHLYGVTDDGLAWLHTDWGEGLYRVNFSEDQKRGTIFAPIHWTDSTSANAVTGRLVSSARDPLSGQPEFKYTPVSIEAAIPEWRGFFLSSRAVASPQCSYWVQIVVDGGVLYELAGLRNCPMPDLDELGGGAARGGERIEIVNRVRKDYRVARLQDGRLTHCLILTRSGKLPPRNWLSQLLGQETVSENDRALLLSGTRVDGGRDEGALVCACFRVGRNRICETIVDEGLTSVEALGERLGAGTNCGSCRPEIRSLMESVLTEAAA